MDIHLKAVDVTGGICTCGAVYALDRAGHNLGEVFLDALRLACKGDLDKALVLPAEAYETETFDYDIHTNTASRRENRRGRTGKLIFVRLKSDQ